MIPGKRFCGDCGVSFSAGPAAVLPVQVAVDPHSGRVAERRLVSVVFVDLVGFTTLSEGRDAEDVRELLSRYFDSCRRLVELYGGVVEKFIGDAVMAVWGTPVAQEDDAERAVRAALDIVAAVSALGDELGALELRARAGVLTGEAAVNLGAVGEGMVAGDLVNSAARIQAVAEPGTVLVGEATRRASDQAVAYSPGGEHALKGKSEPVAVWRAVRVTAAVGGALRSVGLEAPFVGRERELRLVKELFHSSAEQSRAHLVQISGIAGIGKSRLVWEFFKYLDGLAEAAWWHRGRCLAYGEGVAYWALAEMVRTRARILEGEDPDTARRKISECLVEHVVDLDERTWIGPRLANLLGLEERMDSDRQDLFAAWRLFFERLAERQPVVLVFEDLQWADQALLAFIEYLLEWSSSTRLYVIVCARPEIHESQPDFGRSVRNLTAIGLEPLPDSEMSELLEGYVPGLPTELKLRVLNRAQGVPLYAVETVRMLLDRGLLAAEGAVYRPTERIDELDVPETLHALVAARLDGLPAAERRLVQDACVLGKTFTKPALAALMAMQEAELDPLLASLVRKEVLGFQVDPRSSEQGQYGFLQDLLRQLAYETLSRHDRASRHLAAVEALEQALPTVGEDAPEVIAAHLVAAAEAMPDAPEVAETRRRARAALASAGERASSLAAPEEGQRHFDQAAALADDPAAKIDLLQRAGTLALRAGDSAAARERLEAAILLCEQIEDAAAAARVGVALADVDVAELRLAEATHRLEQALPTLEEAGPSPELAATLGSLGRMFMLRGMLAEATETLERALTLAESLALTRVTANAFTSKGALLISYGRLVEARTLLEKAVQMARAIDDFPTWARAINNLGVALETAEDYDRLIDGFKERESRARQRGDREQLVASLTNSLSMLMELGRWQEALDQIAEAATHRVSRFAGTGFISAVRLYAEMGNLDDAHALLVDHDWQQDSDDPETRAAYHGQSGRLLRAYGRPAEALAAAERGLSHKAELGITDGRMKLCIVEATEAAFEHDDLHRAHELIDVLDSLQPGQQTPFLRAHRAFFHARLGAREGQLEDVDENYRAAAGIFTEHGLVFRLAVVQLEHGEWLLNGGHTADAAPLLDSARGVFERLGARPWLERLDRVTPADRVAD
jgi:predicted ATPase/class 3 adenylate cyclase